MTSTTKSKPISAATTATSTASTMSEISSVVMTASADTKWMNESKSNYPVLVDKSQALRYNVRDRLQCLNDDLTIQITFSAFTSETGIVTFKSDNDADLHEDQHFMTSLKYQNSSVFVEISVRKKESDGTVRYRIESLSFPVGKLVMADRITTKIHWSGPFITTIVAKNDEDLQVNYLGDFSKLRYLPTIFPDPTFTVGDRQEIITQVLIREIKYVTCSDFPQNIQLDKPQYFTSSATPRILNIESRRFGHVQHQNLLEMYTRRRPLNTFKFKNLKIQTGFKLGEGISSS